MNTPGQIRPLPRSTAAKAMPVGAQTSEANPDTASSVSPARAARTYTTATAATCVKYAALIEALPMLSPSGCPVVNTDSATLNYSSTKRPNAACSACREEGVCLREVNESAVGVDRQKNDVNRGAYTQAAPSSYQTALDFAGHDFQPSRLS
jgi:hypothetical protein